MALLTIGLPTLSVLVTVGKELWGMVQEQPPTVIDNARGLPPSQAIGGGPKKRRRQAQLGIATPLRQLRQLAEGVEFPEKNGTVCQFRASFGGRGQISREKSRFTIF